MEELAKKLTQEINELWIKYYYKRFDFEEAKKITGDIQQFAVSLIQGIGDGETEEEQYLKDYILDVLNDYLEAMEQRDAVMLIDTLDNGLREVLAIYTDGDSEDKGDE